MENIGPCAGTGHSNLTTVTIGTVTRAMVTTVTAMITTEKSLTASPVMHVPISCAWERRKPEPHGFISNSIGIPISGCLP
jgi:hypothetical protein